MRRIRSPEWAAMTAIIQPIATARKRRSRARSKRLLETVTQPFELAGRQALVGVSDRHRVSPSAARVSDLLLRNG